jgi:hypothetical protein
MAAAVGFTMRRGLWLLFLLTGVSTGIVPMVDAQSLDLEGDPGVFRGGEAVVTVAGTSTFALSGFVATVVYPEDRLIFKSHSFAEGVWKDADFRVVVSRVPGRVEVIVVGDTTNSEKFVPGGANQNFVDLTFEAGVCTGALLLRFAGELDDNILVDTDAVGHDVVGSNLGEFSASVTEGLTFVRGNANNGPINAAGPQPSQSSVTIADAIFILTNLFAQGVVPPCLDAADANDDGRYDIVDAVTVLQVLFGNPMVVIPEPFENIGSDGGSSLGCDSPPDVTGC